MGNKLVFGDGITNNVSKITTGGARADFRFYVKPEVFLGFDTTKLLSRLQTCSLSLFDFKLLIKL
jgi:hypothetical protein